MLQSYKIPTRGALPPPSRDIAKTSSWLLPVVSNGSWNALDQNTCVGYDPSNSDSPQIVPCFIAPKGQTAVPNGPLVPNPNALFTAQDQLASQGMSFNLYNPKANGYLKGAESDQQRVQVEWCKPSGTGDTSCVTDSYSQWKLGDTGNRRDFQNQGIYHSNTSDWNHLVDNSGVVQTNGLSGNSGVPNDGANFIGYRSVNTSGTCASNLNGASNTCPFQNPAVVPDPAGGMFCCGGTCATDTGFTDAAYCDGCTPQNSFQEALDRLPASNCTGQCPGGNFGGEPACQMCPSNVPNAGSTNCGCFPGLTPSSTGACVPCAQGDCAARGMQTCSLITGTCACTLGMHGPTCSQKDIAITPSPTPGGGGGGGMSKTTMYALAGGAALLLLLVAMSGTRKSNPYSGYLA